MGKVWASSRGYARGELRELREISEDFRNIKEEKQKRRKTGKEITQETLERSYTDA